MSTLRRACRFGLMSTTAGLMEQAGSNSRTKGCVPELAGTLPGISVRSGLAGSRSSPAASAEPCQRQGIGGGRGLLNSDRPAQLCVTHTRSRSCRAKAHCLQSDHLLSPTMSGPSGCSTRARDVVDVVVKPLSAGVPQHALHRRVMRSELARDRVERPFFSVVQAHGIPACFSRSP